MVRDGSMSHGAVELPRHALSEALVDRLVCLQINVDGHSALGQKRFQIRVFN